MFNPKLQKVEAPAGDSAQSWQTWLMGTTQTLANVAAQNLLSQRNNDQRTQSGGQDRPDPVPIWKNPMVIGGAVVGLVVLVLLMRRR
jgi:hypothetical protein